MNIRIPFPSFPPHTGLALLVVIGAAPAAPGQERVPPPLVPIGVVQGAPDPGADARRFESPESGDVVTVQGVIHALLTRYGRRDNLEYGFFIQNTPATRDNDPDTSDGLFVYTQRKPEVRLATSGEYRPRVGDEVILTGKIREIMYQTHLTANRLHEVVRSGVDIEAELETPLVALDVSSQSEAAAYWERHEGMRMRLPAGTIVQDAWTRFGTARDAEIRVLLPDSIPARRDAPYRRRVFRDAHPLDDLPETLFDNDNPTLVLLGSLGLKGASGDPQVLLAPVRTFDVLADPVAGAVVQRYENYSLQPAAQPGIRPGPHPAANGRLAPLAPASHFTVATFNVENLYDARNDPDDPVDDANDPGSPYVSKPFNYLPEDDAAYRRRLEYLARQIVDGFHAPDIVMLQEIEDQDIVGGDGILDALHELAAVIGAGGGPAYGSATDRDAADYRGITTAFLYRTDRVRLASVDASDPVFGPDLDLGYRGAPAPHNRDVSNPKAVNAVLPPGAELGDGMAGRNVFSRALQVARFEIQTRPGADPEPVYLLNNHFSSRPDQRVAHRMEQAAMNACLVRAIQAADPDANIVVGGDLNTFPRPDEPRPDEPADQLGVLYDAGLANLYDDLVRDRPESAYTYVYRGQAGTLDQLFVTPGLHRRLAQVWVAHVNSDWPPPEVGTPPFGASDHDAVLATFRVTQ